MTRGTMILRATRAGRLARIGRYHPYARMINRGLTAYRYGRAGYKTARRVYSAGRSTYRTIRAASRRRAAFVRRRRTMARVGQRVGSMTAKWDQVKTNLTNINPETLYQVPLLDIVKESSGVTAYDRRKTDHVNFRGIKFCVNCRAEGALGTAVAWMNIAIISPRTDLTSSEAIPNAEFFRNPNGTSRGTNFDDASQNNVDYKCNAINTDKYNIHKRSSFVIGPSNSTEGNKNGYLEWYMPIKRQIRYNGGSSIKPEGKNMYMVWWFSTSDGGTPANSVRFQYSFKKYWREPESS